MISKIKKQRTGLGGGEQEGIAPDEPLKISISSFTILKIFGIIAALLFLWSIRDVLGVLFVALVFASALDPWVDHLERFRIPRTLSILGMYLLFIFLFVFVFALMIPPLIQQIGDITNSLGEYAPNIEAIYQRVTHSTDTSLVQQLQSNLSNFNNTLTNITSGFFSAVANVFGAVATILFMLVISFYMTVEEDGLKKFIRSIAPIQYQPYLVQKVNRIQYKMGGWLRGQLILMLIVGVLSFIGLFLIGVPYALVLACVAGFAEFIPFLGPWIAAIPAMFFAYTDAPWKAIAVLIFYTVLQQVENQVIVPKVMQKAVGLNPIVVITVMLIGAKVAGIAGILLAVPATTIVWIFLEDLFEQKKELDNKLEEPVPVAREEKM